jgi:hypothetical protein
MRHPLIGILVLIAPMVLDGLAWGQPVHAAPSNLPSGTPAFQPR